MKGYGEFAQFYDALTGNVDYPGRAGFFHTLLQRCGVPGNLVLDLACGTGSLSLELAALGYDVIGADASAEMLSVAMQKAASADRQMLFLNQSMEELDLYGTVDAVVCALDSINHLPDEKALCKAVDRVSLFLNPGGIFLFDVNTVYKHRSLLADNVYVYDLEQVFCVWQNRWMEEHDTVEVSLDFFCQTGKNNYRRSGECFRERIYCHTLLCEVLRERGLELMFFSDGDTLQPPGAQSQRLVYAAKKG